MKKGAFLVLFIILIAFIATSAYIVDETEQVVVTQFGKVVGEPKNTPGIKFKVPFIQQATYFPKNLLEWDGDPGQVPTLDKTYIWVDVFARWKIVDPIKFFQTVNNVINAKSRLDDIIDSTTRNFITSNRLIESVRKTNRGLDTFEEGMQEEEIDKLATRYNIKIGREKITKGIIEQAKPKLIDFGIELVDVKIKRINYVEEVRQSVYSRMIAERKQIAEKFRSEGMGEAKKIKGEKDKKLKEITSVAYRKAQELKGKADAKSTKIFAAAYEKDPEFYSFVKSLEVYKEVLGEDSSLIMSTDSEFLKYLQKGSR